MLTREMYKEAGIGQIVKTVAPKAGSMLRRVGETAKEMAPKVMKRGSDAANKIHHAMMAGTMRF